MEEGGREEGRRGERKKREGGYTFLMYLSCSIRKYSRCFWDIFASTCCEREGGREGGWVTWEEHEI